MQITLSRVVEAARQRKAAVTAEAGGYILLLTVQRLSAEPRRIDAERIQLTAAGEILIDASEPAPAGDTEATLRSLLATLVSLSHTAPPALRAAAERPAGGGLRSLESELMAALIPINHAASGRALARLFRETEKALRGSSSSMAAPSSVPSSRASSPGGPDSAQHGSTPLPERVSWPEPAASSRQPLPPAATAPPAEAGSLEIDVEVVASEDEQDAGASSVPGHVVSSSVVPSSGVSSSGVPSSVVPSSGTASLVPTSVPSVLSDAPQLIVEELDELDVQELDAEPLEPDAPEPPLPALAQASIAGASAPEAVAEVAAAEAQDVVDELDALLASELPRPPAPPPLGDVTPPPLGDVTPVPGESGADEAAAPRPLLAVADAPAANPEPEPPPQRSDVRELLQSFLAHTRCEEEMAANLRRIVGLEPWRSSRAVEGSKMGPAAAAGRLP